MMTNYRVRDLFALAGGRSRRLVLAAAAIAVLGLPGTAMAAATQAQHAATPKAVVRNFDAALLRVMQDAGRVPYQARYRELSATAGRSFDFADMARIATGPAWSGLPETQKAAIIGAFERYSIAAYLSEFDAYSGQHFEMAGRRELPQGVVVMAKLVAPGESPVTFGYLLHEVGGAWRIIDIYLGGTISQLAIQRSEFTSVLAQGGPSGLVERLAQKTRQLERNASS